MPDLIVALITQPGDVAFIALGVFLLVPAGGDRQTVAAVGTVDFSNQKGLALVVHRNAVVWAYTPCHDRLRTGKQGLR